MPLYPWFDSHCHFDFAAFTPEREAHWRWLQGLGLVGLMIPGISREQGQTLPALCRDQPWYYAQGLHPYFQAKHQLSDLDWLEDQLRQDAQICALGEIGLDLPTAKAQHNEPTQWQFFSAQVQLAQAYRKPLILHIRGYHDQACAFLRQQKFTQGGIVHAFSGSAPQAKAWLDLGFRLRLGGVIAQPSANRMRQLVQELPLAAWLLETDSPDMKAAFWGQPSYSPAAIPLLAAIVAALKDTNLAAVAASQQQQLLNLWPTMNCYGKHYKEIV